MASGNFVALLARVANDAASRDCLLLPGGERRSYGQVFAEAARYAGALAALGVEAGDRVVVQVEKTPENLSLYLATLMVGGVYVPLNSAYTPAEVAYFLGDAEPVVFVCDAVDGGLADDYRAVRFETLDARGHGTMADLAAESMPLKSIAPRLESDLASIVYTSGTTGLSKGAMLSHSNLASNAASLREAWDWQENDVLLHALPIFHVHGLFIAMHCALTSGTPMVWLQKFTTDEVLEWLPESTVLMGVPTFYTRLLAEERFNREIATGVRVFISGSAPLTPQTFDAFQERTGQRILERYGMSETIINTTNPLVGERVAGTVGYALPGVDVRVANDAGEPVPTGEIGMIEVSGPNVFSGYWRKPEKTKEEIRADGYFITGDLGTQTEDGRVSIVGRGKDLVISGGYNVYPKEVEGLIDTMPGVVESAVIGVPHADFGEGVVAVIVPAGDEVVLADVKGYLGDRLAAFKQPKAVVSVAALPRNTMGKVQKNRLREDYATLFEG